MVVRTKDGDICSWRESEWFSKPLAGSASEGKRVIQIACGNYHSLALNAQGEVYAWGANGFGQLGNGENSNDSSDDDDADEAEQQQQQQYYENPVKTTIGDENVKIIQIACGDETSYALDKYGKVITFGQIYTIEFYWNLVKEWAWSVGLVLGILVGRSVGIPS